MAPAPTQGQGYGHARASTSSSTNTLLVVKAHGWHVRHHYCDECTDIYAGLHGRRDAQKIHRIGKRVLLRCGQADVLKQALALA
jgi:hypothetical protein